MVEHRHGTPRKLVDTSLINGPTLGSRCMKGSLRLIGGSSNTRIALRVARARRALSR